MPQIITAHVTAKRTVSDRNYGNETAEVNLTADLAPDDDPDATIAALLAQAQALVLGQLKRSTNAEIQRALETDEERQARITQLRERNRTAALARLARDQHDAHQPPDLDLDDDEDEDEDNEPQS